MHDHDMSATKWTAMPWPFTSSTTASSIAVLCLAALSAPIPSRPFYTNLRNEQPNYMESGNLAMDGCNLCHIVIRRYIIRCSIDHCWILNCWYISCGTRNALEVRSSAVPELLYASLHYVPASSKFHNINYAMFSYAVYITVLFVGFLSTSINYLQNKDVRHMLLEAMRAPHRLKSLERLSETCYITVIFLDRRIWLFILDSVFTLPISALVLSIRL